MAHVTDPGGAEILEGCLAMILAAEKDVHLSKNSGFIC